MILCQYNRIISLCVYGGGGRGGGFVKVAAVEVWMGMQYFTVVTIVHLSAY